MIEIKLVKNKEKHDEKNKKWENIWLSWRAIETSVCEYSDRGYYFDSTYCCNCI